MKTMFIAAAAAATLLAVPAAAVELRVDAHVGSERIQANGGHKIGLLYGVGAGFDVPVAIRGFVGLEADIDDSTTKACADHIFYAGDHACVKTGRELYLGGRAGVKLPGGTKVYVLGGYTDAHLKAVYDFAGVHTSASDNGDGWRLGAGAQFPLSSYTFAKTEYRYSNDHDGLDRHQLLLGLGLRF